MSDFIDPYMMIDHTYLSILETVPNLPDRWLLEQTVNTAQQRRGFLNALPIEDGWNVLDVGAGYGALAFDLAGKRRVNVRAIDMDEYKVHMAREMTTALDLQGFFEGKGKVQFDVGNVYQLAHEDNLFNFVTARFLFQHLNRPIDAVKELYRVTRVGGYVCIIDVDDQLTTIYPACSGYERLRHAVQVLQSKRGGDRFVGRKIPTLLSSAGFCIAGVMVQPTAGFTDMSDSIQLKVLTEHFYRDREALAKEGILTLSQFDDCMNDLLEGLSGNHFQSHGEIVVMAQKVS